ncbi:PaaI family thioesterase [Stenotrophobium rhamnosiphilum]|uniref:Thioesterase n=1 Tax=Stenotrophobium rhamnosiphilum TaxID=2029166 RepID=A0A2T5MFH0_9GAMM|nr:PaaI family thioesterase [Stenotrophobium rhamnosiphilum]PTU31312.1 thioesterase [Stenotrophobium rhamnosiphilum]
MEVKLSGDKIEQLIQMGFGAKEKMFTIENLVPGSLRLVIPYQTRMLRPGNVLSGPSLFTAADLAMYALVIGHIGPEMMAVTANMNLNFLNKATPGNIIADGRLLKLGRKLAVMEVSLYSSADPETLVAHATGSYSIPSKK